MTSTQYDSRTADKFVVRLPDGLRSAIEAAALADDRSMNSVFVKATRQYLDGQSRQQILLDTLANTVITPTRVDSSASHPGDLPSGLVPPAIGEYWVGQGGIYGGRREYPEGLCYVIFAVTDVGRHSYGEYGTNVEATSGIDGRENTAILVNREGSHPAADAASAYTCDGHNDFYLPGVVGFSITGAQLAKSGGSSGSTSIRTNRTTISISWIVWSMALPLACASQANDQ